MVRLFLAVLFIACVGPALAQAQTRIASWNIQNLGWNNNKDFEALARVGAYFDLIAVQEVMNTEGIASFQRALEAETGADWERICSHLVGRSSYLEKYCFVWRIDEVTWTGGAAVYLDDRDLFAREPFSANFMTRDGFKFVATSIHAIYGNSVAERVAEAQALRQYRDWLVSISGELPVFLMGDFNLPPTNPAWSALGEVMHPLIQAGATTISTVEGRYANLYDNIWVPADTPLPISAFGRLEFPSEVLGMSHAEARDRVSDHIPVWAEIGPLEKEYSFPPLLGATMEDSHDDRIIGNRRSGIFHLPGCPSYRSVGQENRVFFSSEEEAVSLGYRRAGNCSDG